MWVQNYYAPDPETGALRLRTAQDMPPGVQLVQSPYDGDARFSTKRETSWIGYRLHLTETCEEDLPRLITQVATVPATTNGVEMTAVIQADLAARDLLPGEHLLDAGYVLTRYRKRAGVEGTMAQGAQAFGARRARYRSLRKVQLEHVAIAAAISLQRLDAWWTETLPATTRISRFAALAA